MVTPLLVLTQDFAFGGMISRSLEETERFSVRVLSQIDEAVAYVQKEKCSLTFLDLDLTDPLKDGRALQQANAEMRFIFLSGVNPDPVLDELNPRAHLTKPFYLPDLLEMMDRLFPSFPSVTPRRMPQNAPVASPVTDSELPWLVDVNRAAQQLTRLTLESSAQAALISRENKLWAYAGQLPQTAAHELASLVVRYWDKAEESDLVRFVRLNSTNAEHMLFATHLGNGMVLALAFDAETPFSTIRTQAGRLVHSLSVAQLSDQEVGDDEGLAAASQAVVEGAAELQSGRQETLAQEETSLLEAQTGTQPSQPVEEEGHIYLDPVSASIYNLTYACLLIPRFPQHHLTGDLAERLPEWLQETCIAFGWRLEFISVRPDYLHWLVNVPPASAPSYLMRIMRQTTSGKIFEEFPRFKKENPSGDFWAPGYLIMGGTQPAPAQMIKDFIQQTRQRQGASRSLKSLYREFHE